MKIQAIRAIAREHHIKPLPPSKLELVRAIQSREGNFPCFGTAVDGECDRVDCIWREDCLGIYILDSPLIQS